MKRVDMKSKPFKVRMRDVPLRNAALLKNEPLALEQIQREGDIPNATGDWYIVDNGNGTYSILEPEAFHHHYEIMDLNG